MKPEDGKAAVTAESLSRLASVGLQYGFFIGCLDPVDDEHRRATYARCPPRQAQTKFGTEENLAAKQPAGEPMSAPAGVSVS
ncbi:hypothetical protein LB572_05765 [Mesorhizobium sp. BH1-1-5]|uniref:hypothetical protein n=1 Tax=unclassified Mesorhizobium TaxID=325217 RepID=UPI0015E49641|nr:MULTISPECIES: hypothetical protein [unclassified Mesorhizobium]MBZ9986601.1 hypothetical protein [Mesorhizobium sp. BH1-1-5]